jgi:chromosomal replication initiation ATPase DnaA
VLGDDDFLTEVSDTPLEGLPPTLGVIIEHVCARYGTNEVALGEPSRVRRLAAARAMIGWLAMRTGTASLTEVSRRFHRDVATMSKQVRRLDLAVKQNTAVARELAEILNAIRQ